MKYLHWDEKTIADFSPEHVADLYDRGYVFTRLGRGVMHQTRSVRINLAKFDLSSENRRILKKNMNIEMRASGLPVKTYDYTIGKMAKDFYDTKFGPGIMSAQKIKESITDAAKSNFNLLLTYSSKENNNTNAGYAICHEEKNFLHYSYPFYDMEKSSKDMGLGMMTLAAEYVKKSGKKYLYLGSLQRPTDAYKFQFSGMEWFDGGPDGTRTWNTDIEAAKKILRNIGSNDSKNDNETDK